MTERTPLPPRGEDEFWLEALRGKPEESADAPDLAYARMLREAVIHNVPEERHLRIPLAELEARIVEAARREGLAPVTQPVPANGGRRWKVFTWLGSLAESFLSPRILATSLVVVLAAGIVLDMTLEEAPPVVVEQTTFRGMATVLPPIDSDNPAELATKIKRALDKAGVPARIVRSNGVQVLSVEVAAGKEVEVSRILGGKEREIRQPGLYRLVVRSQ